MIERTQNKTCFSYWYPKLINAGFKQMPQTEILTTDFEYLPILKVLYGEDKFKNYPALKDLIEKIQQAGDRFGWPCFLRTGQTSAKHEWERTCFLENRNKAYLRNHIIAIVEFSEIAGGLIGLDCAVWVVRKMLKTEPFFYAFQGMPITKERRYFIQNGKVECHHPYWPEEAFQDDAFTNLIRQMNKESENEIGQLTDLSTIIGMIFPEYWSMDWLYSSEGWMLTDMAEGEKSYHWPTCENIKRG